jgi:uncharacterized protein (DUF305 family)
MKHVFRTALLFVALTLTACGGSDPAPAGTGFNDADVTFATQMIPHHQQAVEMSDLALRKATTVEVKNLATAIKAAQAPEIQELSGRLTAWGKPVPTPSEQMGHLMSGMMTAAEMADLSKASGSMFDRMWTQMMIKHHQGAVTMAKTEETTGKDPASVALAKKIQTAQTTEIATMKRLLGQLPVA